LETDWANRRDGSERTSPVSSGCQNAGSEPAPATTGRGLTMRASTTTPEEMSDAREWLEEALNAARGKEAGQAEGIPFSFVYDGRPSSELLPGWTLTEDQASATEGVVKLSLVWTDPSTGLRISLVVTEYTDFPVVEWGVRLKNTGAAPTPIIEQIQSMQLLLRQKETVSLHHFTGDYAAEDGYEPHEALLTPGTVMSFAPVGGRPTNRAFPYYNLELRKEKRGVIVVIGWPGQWAARFAGEKGSLRVTGGQELTHFSLLPGEEVRSPLSVVLFWRGDPTHAQNLWRRWMMLHNMPRPEGKLPPPIMPANSSIWFEEMVKATEEDQKFFIDRYRQEGIVLDYWWMDAGWYACTSWPQTGTWEVDRRRFPRGLRAVADHAHALGMKVIVWFEPERVAPGTWLDSTHPEWLLCIPEEPKKDRLLFLGNPEALAWLIHHVGNLISEQGIDLYRQDFNFDPLPYWRANDAPDRQGMTEIRHVEGYLAYWDALLQKHPALLIDSCASGGRRDDLETLRRAVPLLTTDYNYADLPVKQAFHHTLFQWMPYFGASVNANVGAALPIEQVEPYAFRSAMAPCTVIGFDMRREDLDCALLRRLTNQWRQVAAYYYGDYYPLTPYERAGYSWISWQFHRPEQDDGLVQVFRRAQSPYECARLLLKALDPDAMYEVRDLDEGEPAVISGAALTEQGLSVAMPNPPQARIIVYKRRRDGGSAGA